MDFLIAILDELGVSIGVAGALLLVAGVLLAIVDDEAVA
jgi:hypothetical protein